MPTRLSLRQWMSFPGPLDSRLSGGGDHDGALPAQRFLWQGAAGGDDPHLETMGAVTGTRCYRPRSR